MVDPRLGIDQLKDSDPLGVRNRPLTGESPLDQRPIEDCMRGELPIEQPLPDRHTEVIEELRTKPARATLDASFANDPREVGGKGTASN